jgi:DNA-binding cell septation regulator SpoVG
MSARIEVLAIRAVNGAGTIRAFVDLQVGAVRILGAKLVQEANQRPWLAMPSTKSDRGWNNVIEITSKELKARLTEAVLAAWSTRQQEGATERDRAVPASGPATPLALVLARPARPARAS